MQVLINSYKRENSVITSLIYFFICSEFFTVWTQNYREDNLWDSLKQSKFYYYILEQSVKFSYSA